MDNNGELWEIAVLGKQVDDFMHSDVGKYVLARADAEYAEAIEVLKHCELLSEVVKYQSAALRAESIRKWLEEAVATGLQALKLIEDRE